MATSLHKFKIQFAVKLFNIKPTLSKTNLNFNNNKEVFVILLEQNYNISPPYCLCKVDLKY